MKMKITSSKPVEKPLMVIFLVLLSLLVSCTKKGTNPDRVEIPFEIIKERVIIEATFNGKKGRYIFDTGATESYLNIKTINLLPIGYARTPYKEKASISLVYALKKASFGNTVIKTNSSVLTRSDYLNRTIKEGYDGIIGVQIFNGYWCELSFSKKKIILHKEKPSGFPHYSFAKILSKHSATLNIPVIIDGNYFGFNFDTGAQRAFYFPDKMIEFQKKENVKKVSCLINEVRNYHIVQTESIHILDQVYNKKAVLTNSFLSSRFKNDDLNGIGLLGVSFLKHYDWLLDYTKINKGTTTGLYYIPNTPLEKRRYGSLSFFTEIPEFGILYFSIRKNDIVILTLLTDSIAYTVYGLRPGTKITKINNIPATQFSIETLLDPMFYSAVDNFTILENDTERIIVPGNKHPIVNQR